MPTLATRPHAPRPPAFRTCRRLLPLLPASAWTLVGALLGATAMLALCTMPARAQASVEAFQDKLVTIGTASRSGSFFPIGTKLCDIVNRSRNTDLVRCVAYATSGSEYNTKAVVTGDLTMGMTRSDLAYAAYRHVGNDGELNGQRLRLVMSLYPMPVVVIVKQSSGIARLDQLAGHSINYGNEGSGQRSEVEMLVRALQLTRASFSSVTELNTTDMGKAFCEGRVDVIVEALGNPSAFYQRMIEKCDGRMLSFTPDLVARIARDYPLVRPMVVPGGLYAGHAAPTLTVGYRAVLVTNAQVSDPAVQRFVRNVLDHLPELRNLDPVLANLDQAQLLDTSGPVPLHDAVRQALAQAGGAP